MPHGDITDYDELIDVGDNFNPSTGVFTVGKKQEDEGTYVFLLSGRKNGAGKNRDGKRRRIVGDIRVKKALTENCGNKCGKLFDTVQNIFEKDTSNTIQLSSMVSVNLKQGDQIKLYNSKDDSIYIGPGTPFTLTGYKV